MVMCVHFLAPAANFPIELEPRGTDMGGSLFTKETEFNKSAFRSILQPCFIAGSTSQDN